MDSIVVNDNKLFFYSLDQKKGIAISGNRIDIFKEFEGDLRLDFVLDINETIDLYIHEMVNIRLFETLNSMNFKMNINILENAEVEYFSLVKGEELKKVFNLSSNSSLNYYSYLVSLNKLNNEQIFNLLDEFANLNIKVLDVAFLTEIHDSSITINHLSKNTFADLVFYAASKDQAKINVSGINKINKGMNKSVSTQKTRGIVLNEGGKIKALPILLIDEFDCVAKHGATIGKISDEGLFYLMSRGLSKEDSLKLIVQGFIDPLIKEINEEEFKKRVLIFVNNKL